MQKNTLFTLGLLLVGTLATMGQNLIKTTKIEASKLPVGVKYEGKVKTALGWKDNAGEHIVLIAETGIYQNKKFKHENDGSDAELLGYHYIVTPNKAELVWKVYDFIKDCPLDIEASFIKNTFQVTDLNKDGNAEIWLMYKTVCHGDVSPCDMKIIMYEDKQKFAMRGQNRIQFSEKEFMGGEYKFDQAFNAGPKEFREFAKNLWNKNILQKSEE